ncbi:MAG: NfeD family protein [Candidatus Thorarchaeota archaeon]
MSKDLQWVASTGPVRWKMYTRRYWAIRSISLASDQIIAGFGMAIVHVFLGIRIPLWVVGLVFGVLVVKDVLVMWPCIAVSRLWPLTGREGMVGKMGEALSELDPTGIVKVGNEIWRARIVDGRAREGEAVEVLDVQGLTLRVRKAGGG